MANHITINEIKQVKNEVIAFLKSRYTAEKIKEYFVFTKDYTTLLKYYGNEETLTLPPVIEIHYGCCVNNKSIKHLIIPTNTAVIGSEAFHNCANLESVVLGYDVRFIYERAFSECVKLRTVQFGDNVKEILSEAFAECHSLESPKFNNKLEYIGMYSFLHCLNVTSIDIPNSVKEIARGAFSNHQEMKQGTKLDYKSIPTKIRVGSGVEKVGDICFSNRRIKDIHFASKPKMNYGAFFDSDFESREQREMVEKLLNK